MKLNRYVDHQRLHIVTKDFISLSISVLLLFRHYLSHKITFDAPSSGGVLCSACGAFIHSKMSFTCKNPEIFPRKLRSLGFYNLTFIIIQGPGSAPLNTSIFNVYPKSFSVWLVLLPQVLSCSFNLKFLISNSLLQ